MGNPEEREIIRMTKSEMEVMGKIATVTSKVVEEEFGCMIDPDEIFCIVDVVQYEIARACAVMLYNNPQHPINICNTLTCSRESMRDPGSGLETYKLNFVVLDTPTISSNGANLFVTCNQWMSQFNTMNRGLVEMIVRNSQLALISDYHMALGDTNIMMPLMALFIRKSIEYCVSNKITAKFYDILSIGPNSEIISRFGYQRSIDGEYLYMMNW